MAEVRILPHEALSIPLYGFLREEGQAKGSPGSGSFNSIVWIPIEKECVWRYYVFCLSIPLHGFAICAKSPDNQELVATFNSIVWIPRGTDGK